MGGFLGRRKNNWTWLVGFIVYNIPHRFILCGCTVFHFCVLVLLSLVNAVPYYIYFLSVRGERNSLVTCIYYQYVFIPIVRAHLWFVILKLRNVSWSDKLDMICIATWNASRDFLGVFYEHCVMFCDVADLRQSCGDYSFWSALAHYYYTYAAILRQQCESFTKKWFKC